MLIIVDLTAARVETIFQQCSQTIPHCQKLLQNQIIFLFFSRSGHCPTGLQSLMANPTRYNNLKM